MFGSMKANDTFCLPCYVTSTETQKVIEPLQRLILSYIRIR